MSRHQRYRASTFRCRMIALLWEYEYFFFTRRAEGGEQDFLLPYQGLYFAQI